MMIQQEQTWANLPEPFNFYRLMLEGDSLHFGYWPEAQGDMSLENAQIYMSDLLLQFFPNPPAKVLDVGCGLGAFACVLAQKGYEVVAICPSPDLIAYARQRHPHVRVRYETADFMAEDISGFMQGIYDVVLFQESLQYLHPLEKVFQRTRNLLAPKGKIILGDEMCHDNAITSMTSVHLRKNVTMRLAENGFRISQQLPIGSRVLRTCDDILNRFTTHHDRLVRIIATDGIGSAIDRFIEGWGSQRRWYAKSQMGYEIIIAHKDAVCVREYQNGDETAILPLFRKAFGVQRSLAHWEWKFKNNPYGACKIAEAYSEDRMLAAHFCGYPVPFHVSCGTQNDFVTLQGGDTMTNPSFRGSGLGRTSLLNRVASYFYSRFCEDATPFIYGFNTGVIRKFGERFLQYEYLPDIPYHVAEINQLPQRISGYDGASAVTLTVEKVLEISDEFDEFYRTVCHSYEFLVARCAEYLQWRYLDCPDQVHRMYAVRKCGKLVGWGVFRISENVLLWGDALFDSQCPQAVNEILYRAIDDCEPGIERIEGWFSPAPTWWTNILASLNFRVEKEPHQLCPCFKFFDKTFSTEILHQRCYYTMGDSDLF